MSDHHDHGSMVSMQLFVSLMKQSWMHRRICIILYYIVFKYLYSFIHSAISIAPLQVLYPSEALPTTARILYQSFTPKRPSTAMGKQRCFWFDYLQEKRQVLRSDKDVERLDDKREARALLALPKRRANNGKGCRHGHSCPSPRDK